MSFVIVLTVLNVSCIFPILFSSLQSIFTIIILNSLSGRLFISSSFIWSCEFLPCSFICAVFLCLCIIFFFLNCSTWGLLFPGFSVVFLLLFLVFALGRIGWLDGLYWFLVRGDLCLFSYLMHLVMMKSGSSRRKNTHISEAKWSFPPVCPLLSCSPEGQEHCFHNESASAPWRLNSPWPSHVWVVDPDILKNIYVSILGCTGSLLVHEGIL